MAKSIRAGKRFSARGSTHQYTEQTYTHAQTTTATHHPPTPIPPRASAYPAGVARVRSRYPHTYTTSADVDVTRLPTWPQPPEFTQIDTDTLTETSPTLPTVSTTRSPTPIDEIATQPQGPGTSTHYHHIYTDYALAAIDIMPPAPLHTQQQRAYKRSFAQRRLDHLRWWLLGPGRIEYLFWSGGTVLLLGITALIMLIIGMGAVISPDHLQAQTTPMANIALCHAPASQVNRAQETSGGCVSIATASGIKAIMFNGRFMVSNSALYLSGQGFSTDGTIDFTYDAHIPCTPASTQADTRGDFSVVMNLNARPAWQAGNHQITIEDMTSHHSITLHVVFTPTQYEQA